MILKRKKQTKTVQFVCLSPVVIVLWRLKPGPELTQRKIDCFHGLQREFGLDYVMLQNYKCLSERLKSNLFMIQALKWKKWAMNNVAITLDFQTSLP